MIIIFVPIWHSANDIFFQEQALTEQIKELQQKVKQNPGSNFKLNCNMHHVTSISLQGNLLHHENIELYKKVNIIRQENTHLQKQVTTGSDNSIDNSSSYTCLLSNSVHNTSLK